MTVTAPMEPDRGVECGEEGVDGVVGHATLRPRPVGSRRSSRRVRSSCWARAIGSVGRGPRIVESAGSMPWSRRHVSTSSMSCARPARSASAARWPAAARRSRCPRSQPAAAGEMPSGAAVLVELPVGDVDGEGDEPCGEVVPARLCSQGRRVAVRGPVPAGVAAGCAGGSPGWRRGGRRRHRRGDPIGWRGGGSGAGRGARRATRREGCWRLGGGRRRWFGGSLGRWGRSRRVGGRRGGRAGSVHAGRG